MVARASILATLRKAEFGHLFGDGKKSREGMNVRKWLDEMVFSL